jgi:hypothetical protein
VFRYRDKKVVGVFVRFRAPLQQIRNSSGFLESKEENFILQNRNSLTKESLQELLSVKIRTEKVAIKDAKLRTFTPKIVVGMI